jgi:hypothetical protein
MGSVSRNAEEVRHLSAFGDESLKGLAQRGLGLHRLVGIQARDARFTIG